MREALRQQLEGLQNDGGDVPLWTNPSRPSTPRDKRVLCSTPLAQQIEALMRSLPPAQRNRPWSMGELVARLHGRFHANPCAGDVGRTLRVLGWTRCRDWRNCGEGRRIWFPPAENPLVSRGI